MKQPYFRQTKHLDTESQAINWFEHHKKLGTPVGLIWQHGRYSVWIIGEEKTGPNKEEGRLANQELIEVDSILVNEANNFMSLAGISLNKRKRTA